MNTHLYQEESEHGVGATSPPVERAKEVERRITDLLASGKFILNGGYQSKQSDGKCVGCAVGALAYALGCDRTTMLGPGCSGPVFRDSFIAMHRAGIEGGLCNREEVFQLEMGYEGLRSIPFENGCVAVRANESDPFYLVGASLRESAGIHGTPVLSISNEEWAGCA